MHRFHLVRNLRSFAFLLVAAAAVAAMGTLWWANQTGLPESWRLRIENEVAKRGTFVRIGSLSYHPLRGLVAREVRVFADAERRREISRLEGLILDFDNAKLAKGEFQLAKIELNNATLSLPLHPDDPHTEVLEITRANGTFILPGSNRIEIHNARGMIAGIQLSLNARFSNEGGGKGGPTGQKQSDGSLELVAEILKELRQWSFDSEQAPELKLDVEGNIRKPDSTKARLSLVAKSVGKNQHQLDHITATAELSGKLLTITSLEAVDGQQRLSAGIDYDLDTRSGRFDVDSSLEIPPLLSSWFHLPPLPDLLVAGKQHVNAVGEFTIPEDGKPRIHMIGKASGEATLLRGILFDRIETSFAWRDGDLFLKDIHLKRFDGEAFGKVLIQWPLVRLELDSSLSPPIYHPLVSGEAMTSLINGFTTSDGTKFKIRLEGGFDATDRHSWAYTGKGSAEDIRYRGVPIKSASCDFDLSAQQQLYSNGTITFDYNDYPLAIEHDGPRQGTARFDHIRYTHANRLIHVKGVDGKIWPAPMVRLFASKLADSLEVYRFHSSPKLEGSGTIDLAKQGNTLLTIGFSSDNPANYQLLGSEVTLGRPKGTVVIKDRHIAVNNLDFEAFKGKGQVTLEFPGDGNMKCDVQWTGFAMDDINSCFKLNMECGGEITGRLAFTMLKGRLSTMNGSGEFNLEKSELFSVPIFGPLSPLISNVLRDKRSGFERAKTASCSFLIRDGILATDDFKTNTSSLVFAGEGTVDLSNKILDMTMRLNARGLLAKIITLPFRPFAGMFQFRGTGPLSETRWEHVLFTTPNEKMEKILLETPKPKPGENDGN